MEGPLYIASIKSGAIDFGLFSADVTANFSISQTEGGPLRIVGEIPHMSHGFIYGTFFFDGESLKNFLESAKNLERSIPLYDEIVLTKRQADYYMSAWMEREGLESWVLTSNICGEEG